MIKGLEKFRDYLKGYKDQYLLVGVPACDIVLEP